MTPRLLKQSSAVLLLIVLTLLGTLLGTALRRSHPSTDAPQLTVTFLDVGDGDCTLIQSPEGRTILVDTGGAAEASAVMSLLRQRKIKRIDLLILASPRAASVGGLPALLGSGLQVSQVWDDAVADTGTARRAALEAIRRRHIPSNVAAGGDTIQVGSRLFISALWPPPTGPASRRDPLICRVNYGSTAFLLEAPALLQTEHDVISQAGSQIECRGTCTDMVLQAATHAPGAPSPEMLRRATPAIVVLSCGPASPPDQATLQSLQAAGAAVWRTDMQGTITVTAGGRVSPSITATRLRGNTE